jgi:hypothetical protein
VKWEKGASFVRHWVRGDRLTRTLHWRNLVALTTVCTVNGKVVIEVDALVIPTSREPWSTNRL